MWLKRSQVRLFFEGILLGQITLSLESGDVGLSTIQPGTCVSEADTASDVVFTHYRNDILLCG